MPVADALLKPVPP
ncbi:unnamed protein product, partial [Adineta steineri]